MKTFSGDSRDETVQKGAQRAWGTVKLYRQQTWGEGNSVYVEFISDFSFVILYKVWKAVALISGEDNGTPLEYSCLENPMNGEAW